MARKMRTAEEIVAKLGQVDVLIAQGRQAAIAFWVCVAARPSRECGKKASLEPPMRTCEHFSVA